VTFSRSETRRSRSSHGLHLESCLQDNIHTVGYRSCSLANTIDYTFVHVEGIEGNADIYTDNQDNTATVEFCAAEIGLLYHSTALINFAEVKLTYDVNLTTSFTNLTGYAVAQEAGGFTDGGERAINFDGTAEASFCNQTTHAILPNDQSTINQGSLVSVCFKVPYDGDSCSKSRTSLTVLLSRESISGTPSQIVMAGSNIFCLLFQYTVCHEDMYQHWHDRHQHLCHKVAHDGNFFQYSDFTLSTGSGGTLLLIELGVSSGGRQHLRHPRWLADSSNAGASSTTSSFNLSPYRFVNEDYSVLIGSDSGYNLLAIHQVSISIPPVQVCPSSHAPGRCVPVSKSRLTYWLVPIYPALPL
jgi:hypothetical protein